MTPTEFANLLKARNAKFKAMPASIQTLDAAYGSEVSSRLTTAGGNPALFDYPAGNTVLSANSTNTPTSVFDMGKHQTDGVVLVRIVTTIGATPTATYDIQGSNDQNTWTSLSFADSSTPTTFASATFVITTATTVVKYVLAAQRFRYLRVNVTANTNVTNTIDITRL